MAAALAVVSLVAGCGGDDDDPPEADTDAIVYVALGDSFSSGEGAPPYEPGSGSCNVSSLAWPRLLYADTSDVVSVEHRACAGAKTEHMTGRWESRDLAPQIPSEPDPSITLVTLTIGGNNAGFGDIVGTCVVTDCPSPEDEDFVDALTAITDTLVTTVYPALRTAYPEARLVHVGYPRLTPAPGRPVDGCAWLDESDQIRAAGILTALDDAIRTATEQSPAPVEYADVTEALDGHELCTPRPWLNPIGLGTGHAHPNAAGQRGIEEAVAAALGIDLGATTDDDG
ncbi:MAG TPA: SGNH/GDSL hydrolase family protein [Acidimicrobiales bacterium]|nr:SGNH/GDSL hydrolase family protein [Acidimicrobiales bacterium]